MQRTFGNLGARPLRWGRGLSILLVGLSLTLAAPVGVHAATPGAKDCVPAEPPMGNARESLDGRNKDGGLHAQDHAIDELKRCLDESERAARQALDELNNILSNLQAAQPGQGDDQEDDMSADLNELGDIIRQQQQLRDRTYGQGQEKRNRQPGRNSQPGDQNGFGELQKNQQALRDRLKKEMDRLREKGFGQPGGDQNNGESDPLGDARGAMDDAQNSLGDQNADGAVDSQERALEALRRGQQALSEDVQRRMQEGQGPGGTGDPRRSGRQRAQQDTDPLGRPRHGYDDGSKVPLEADVQRARRILEELRRRYGDTLRSQMELDYIERLLKGY